MKDGKKNSRAVAWLFQRSKPQALSIVLLIISKALLASSSVIFALICRGVIDGAASRNKQVFLLYALGLLGLILLQLALRLFCRFLEERVKAKLEMLYKTCLFQALLDKDYTQATKYHSGELLNRLTNDAALISDGVTTLLPNLFSLITRLRDGSPAPIRPPVCPCLFVRRDFALFGKQGFSKKINGFA